MNIRSKKNVNFKLCLASLFWHLQNETLPTLVDYQKLKSIIPNTELLKWHLNNREDGRVRVRVVTQNWISHKSDLVTFNQPSLFLIQCFIYLLWNGVNIYQMLNINQFWIRIMFNLYVTLFNRPSLCLARLRSFYTMKQQFQSDLQLTQQSEKWKKNLKRNQGYKIQPL